MESTTPQKNLKKRVFAVLDDIIWDFSKARRVAKEIIFPSIRDVRIPDKKLEKILNDPNLKEIHDVADLYEGDRVAMQVYINPGAWDGIPHYRWVTGYVRDYIATRTEIPVGPLAARFEWQQYMKVEEAVITLSPFKNRRRRRFNLFSITVAEFGNNAEFRAEKIFRYEPEGYWDKTQQSQAICFFKDGELFYFPINDTTLEHMDVKKIYDSGEKIIQRRNELHLNFRMALDYGRGVLAFDPFSGIFARGRTNAEAWKNFLLKTQDSIEKSLYFTQIPRSES